MAVRHAWVTLLVGVVTSLLHLNHGSYQTGGDLTFCKALKHCSDRNWTLPLLSDLASLQEFMKERKQYVTWLLNDGPVSMSEAQAHCHERPRAIGSCPGLVALSTATGVLEPPLADCHYPSVEIAICTQPSVDNSYHVTEEFRGNFCDVVDSCGNENKALVTDGDTAAIRRTLNQLEQSGAWALSAGNNWHPFCSNGNKPRQCPGKIVLRDHTSHFKRSFVGCDVKAFTVICDDQSDSKLSRPTTSPSGTDKAIAPDGTPTGNGEDGNKDGGQLPLILGLVGGIVVLLIIVIIIVAVLLRNKRRRCDRKTHITEATNPTYSVEGHDIISGITDHDYADITDVTDPPSGRSRQPLPSAPPHGLTEPGYSQVSDKVGDKGELVGTYEDIDDLREDLKEDKPNSHRKAENKYSVIPGERGSQYIPSTDDVSPSQSAPRVLDNPYDLEVADSPDVPPETPAPPGSIGAAQDDDVYPDEVTLVENTVYG